MNSPGTRSAQKDLSLFFRTTVLYGEGKLVELGRLLRSFHASKTLLVTDRGIVRAGIAEKCIDAIRSEKIRLTLFDEVEPNPSTDSVAKGLARAKEEAVDTLVALGGGSVIDAAKGINVLLANGGEVVDYRGLDKVKRKGLPLIAIPTTAGSGSEMTSYMLISDSKTHQKIVCSDPNIIPDIALLDPRLTLSLPMNVTIETGVDSLSNGIESYVSRVSNPYSEHLALGVTEIIAENILKVYRQPLDLEARGRMLIASNMGGLAVHLSSIGAAHSMANPLTHYFHITHGIAVAMVLPYVMLFNATILPQKYKEIALALGVSSEAGEDEGAVGRKGVLKLRHLLDQLSLPSNLAEMGVKEDLIPTMAGEALEQVSLDYNPIKPNLQEMKDLYISALRGSLCDLKG
jgi:alcohol dehydrogenase